jgi:hypothetical protein
MGGFLNRGQNGILYLIVRRALREHPFLKNDLSYVNVVRCIKIFISECWKFLFMYAKSAVLYRSETIHLS